MKKKSDTVVDLSAVELCSCAKHCSRLVKTVPKDVSNVMCYLLLGLLLFC